MSQETLLGTDKLNVAYQKINDNFDELYAGGGGGGGGAVDLKDLADVQITLPIVDDEALVYDTSGNKWKNQAIPRSLTALSDTNIVSATTGQTLQWNGTKWINANIDLDQLSDTIISSPASGQVLEYNGTNWVNGTIDLDQLSDVVITTPANYDYLRYDNMSEKWVNSVAGFQSQQGFEIERVYSKTRLLMGVV